MKIKHVGKMTVAGHRGDCYNCYENTMKAFEKAISDGVDMIETDIHMTSDGHLVLIHDHTLNRTTDAKGEVKNKTLAELQLVNAGDKNNFASIPMLEDILKLAVKHDITLNLEIKVYYKDEGEERTAKCIEDTLALVEKYNMTDKILINSFDAWVLEYVYKKYGKKYMLHGFYPYSIMSNVSVNPDDYLYCACIFETKNKAYYDYLAEKNIETWIGAGVTQQELLALCIEYGARLITTNNPEDTLKKLKNLEAR